MSRALFGSCTGDFSSLPYTAYGSNSALYFRQLQLPLACSIGHATPSITLSTSLDRPKDSRYIAKQAASPLKMASSPSRVFVRSSTIQPDLPDLTKSILPRQDLSYLLDLLLGLDSPP